MSRIKTVKDITIAYLKEHGYDGLFNLDRCHCLLVDGIEPYSHCRNQIIACRPGVKTGCDCALQCEYHMGLKPSELCIEENIQNCHACDDLECHDNMSKP